MYELLPFLCQFVGNETGQEVSQTCLKALCYLSVCITPANAIPFALEMIWKVAQSESWKAKMSSLEFAQTFVFTNFMSLCLHPEYVKQIENLVVNLMSDDRLQVRAKATKILCGLIHSEFIDKEGQVRLLKDFRTKIRRKMTKKANGNGSLKFKKEKLKNLKSMDKTELAAFHSGILGLCAMVSWFFSWVCCPAFGSSVTITFAGRGLPIRRSWTRSWRSHRAWKTSSRSPTNSKDHQGHFPRIQKNSPRQLART